MMLIFFTAVYWGPYYGFQILRALLTSAIAAIAAIDGC